ncbi:uncharacterized protein LOC134848515 [Symsagittifera roscoffensis]|uniref:uncharacterized protein LOC134848515 n=1 Tax=Symsagittifera roscoffensis TaxID=84072 RepID=UPI00307C801C
MKCSAPRLLLWLSFLLALGTFCFTGFAHNKGWFDVPTTGKSPSISMWHVCYDGFWRDCEPVMTQDAKYNYGIAVMVTRVLLITSMFFSLALTVMGAMTLMGSYKLIGYTYTFPVVALITAILLMVGCATFEGGVRLKVLNQILKINEQDIHSRTYIAGFSAWGAFAMSAINCVINGLLYLKTRYETYI